MLGSVNLELETLNLLLHNSIDKSSINNSGLEQAFAGTNWPDNPVQTCFRKLAKN